MKLPVPRLVRWMSEDEWCRVYRSLYSKEDPEFGIERVRVWRARGKIPLAIECSADISQVFLDEAKPHSNEHELRLSLAMILIRFVNGLVDVQQQKVSAHSISHLAEDLNLPRTLVDVRHDATHGELPSFHVLKYAAEEAMTWLEKTYWIPQLNVVEDTRKITMRFLKEVRHYLQKPSTVNTSSIPPDGAHIRSVPMALIRKLVDSISPNLVSETLVPLLFRTDCLIPKLITKDQGSLEQVLQSGWGDLLTCLASQWDHFSFAFLKYIINKLHQHHLTKESDLLNLSSPMEHQETLFMNHHHQSTIPNQESFPNSNAPDHQRVLFSKYRLNFYVGLANYMLDYQSTISRQGSATISSVMMIHRFHENLLKILFYKWNPSNELIAHHLVNREPHLKGLLDSFMKFSSLSTDIISSQEKVCDWNKEDIIQRQARFRNSIESTRTTTPRDHTSSSVPIPWMKETTMDWSTCPIGSLPRSRFPCLDLGLDECQTVSFEDIPTYSLKSHDVRQLDHQVKSSPSKRLRKDDLDILKASLHLII